MADSNIMSEVQDFKLEIVRLRQIAEDQAQALQQLHHQQEQLRHSSGPPSFTPTCKANKPEVFTGKDHRRTTLWLETMEDYLSLSRVNLDSPDAVRYAVTFMSEDARRWWTAHRQEHVVDTWAKFAKAIAEKFRDLNAGTRAREQLDRLHQDQFKSVREYAQRFLSVMLEVQGMSVCDQIHRFKMGLHSRPRLEVELQQPQTLSAAMTIAERIDSIERSVRNDRSSRNQPRQFNNYRPEPTPTTAPPAATSNSGPVPMQLDTMKFEGKGKGPKCFKCGKRGHVKAKCPERKD